MMHSNVWTHLVYRHIWGTTALVIGGAFIYHMILVRIGREVAWFDAFTLNIGIIATILEPLRYREQYVLWIITDIVSVGIYIDY